MMSHTGTFHGGGFADGFDPSAELQKAYNKLASWPRFTKTNGSDFVFYSPHPATGLSQTEMKCMEFSRSLHIVVEALQRRPCSEPADQNYVVVPYASPHFIEDQGAWPAQSHLLFFLGSCEDGEDASYGKKMRSLFVKLVRQSTSLSTDGSKDIYVHCTGDQHSQAHDQLRHNMRRSLFCIVLPGDTASSRRLTEAVLAGCIPVFVGPPWSSMPLAHKINYTQIALFFQLNAFQEVLQETLPDQHMLRGDDVFDYRGWSPDTDISAHVVQAATASDIIDMLRSMDKHKVKHLLQNAAMVSSLFRYRHLSTDDEQHSSPTVPDAVIELMCSRVMESGSNTIESI
ncbi:hypothetical protein ABBQ32_008853 [Trebouxia sp. C0010 RCD-2024]